ncbi:MAG: ATP-binding protein [Alphaproteobacteria bacterium]|nr:ATP-binding protein [Alphaproteobacteria bacterium]
MAEEKLINRPEYLEKLKKWSSDASMVKIVTGVRRCGKSKLLVLFGQYLLSTGVDATQIHKIDLDMLDNQWLLDPHKLYEHVMSLLVPGKMNYVFLDEIQMVPEWQKVANTLRDKENVDLYLTGSNAYMFSSKLATLLGGRYTEIKMQPLSFKEFVDGLYPMENGMRFVPDLKAVYARYIAQSGFPQTLKYDGDSELIDEYLLDSVYNNTINKDIIERYNLRSPQKLNEVVKFMFDNISKETSILNIEKQLGDTVSNDSINKYVQGLLDSYMLYRCERMDLKGKKILTSSPKYYVCDAGLRQVVLGRKIGDDGKILENVVYLELLRRGYTVNVGKISKKLTGGGTKELEVDFVATKGSGVVEYYQISKSVVDEDVFMREMASLAEIDDNYPKYLITLDGADGEYNGVKHVNALSWLLDSADK